MGWRFVDYLGWDDIFVSGYAALDINPASREPEIDVEIGSSDDVHAYDFGPVVLGEDGTRTITVRNEGFVALTVSQAEGLEAPFTLTPINGATSGDDWVIPAQGTATFEVTFSPTAVGVVTDTLTLTSDDTDESTYEITLQGQGVELATISGQVWDDANFDGVNDIGEAKLSGWTVFIDDNENGFLDADETSVVTDGTGSYQFTDIRPGEYTISTVLELGWKRTAPAESYYTVTANYDDDIIGMDFGYRPWTSAVPQAYSTTEDITDSGAVAGYDPEGDPMTFAVVTSPSHGTLTSFDVNTGAFTYVPDENYNGDDYFTFTATDGAHLSDPATVQITVAPVNDAPEAVGTSGNADEDVLQEIPLTVSDLETPVGQLTYTVTTLPEHGTVYILAGVAYYKGSKDYSGPDSFGFTVTDRGDPNGTATSPALTSEEVFVTVEVAPVNDLPEAHSKYISQTYSCEPVTMTLVGMDAETARGDLFYGIVNEPLHGTVTINGATATYMSSMPAGSSGFTDSFVYSVTDGDGDVSTAEVVLEFQADGEWIDIEYGWNIRYTEVDGTTVLIKPRGVWGSLYFEGQNIKPMYGRGKVLEITGQNIQLGVINLEGSLSTGTLSFHTDKLGDGLAQVGEIRGVDPMRYLYAPKVDLVGNGIYMGDDGFIATTKLHDLLNNANVVMAGDGATSGVKFYAHHVDSGLSMNFGSPVRLLSVAEWTGGTLTAPAAKYIKTTGDAANGIAGDLGIDMNFTGTFGRYSLYKVRVANEITGGTWDLAGNVGVVIAGAIAETWALNCMNVAKVYTSGDMAGTIVSSGSIGSIMARGNIGQAGADLVIHAAGANSRGVGIKSIKAGGSVLGDNVEISSNGGIGSVTVGDWAADSGSNILAGSWVGSLVSKGDFAADVRLSDSNKGYALRKARVAGDITGGSWSVPGGNVGSVVAGNTSGDWCLSVIGSVRSLYSYGNLAGAVVTMGEEGWIGKISARGDLGQENKRMIIRALGQNSRGSSIGSLKGGQILGSHVEITAGNGGSIGRMNVLDWSAESGRQTLQAGTIRSLVVRGDKRRGLAGDFTPSQVTLTNQTHNYALIKGWIAGEWDHDSWNHRNGSIAVGRNVLDATA